MADAGRSIPQEACHRRASKQRRLEFIGALIAPRQIWEIMPNEQPSRSRKRFIDKYARGYIFCLFLSRVYASAHNLQNGKAEGRRKL
uniref:Uncharacterized protein n=1 Tax=Trichogramma kaykai TaxID=54128 RepID=A0ABD2WXB4_9HYME